MAVPVVCVNSCQLFEQRRLALTPAAVDERHTGTHSATGLAHELVECLPLVVAIKQRSRIRPRLCTIASVEFNLSPSTPGKTKGRSGGRSAAVGDEVADGVAEEVQ